MKKLGLRQILIAAAVLIVLVNGAVAYRLYHRAAQVPPSAAATAVATAPAEKSAVSRDLTVLLAPHKAVPTQYKVIEDKNLFSPQRIAWHPPKPTIPAPGKANGTVAPKRGDVVLDATFTVGSRHGAMLRFLRFSKQLQYQRLYQGQEAADTTRSKNIRYTLLKVEKDRVRIKDQYGKEFDVSLYDNKNHTAATTAAATPKVIIGHAAANMSSAAVVAGKGTLAQARNLANKKHQQRQMQKKLATGEYVQVKTPFGVSYVKAVQHKK